MAGSRFDAPTGTVTAHPRREQSPPPPAPEVPPGGPPSDLTVLPPRMGTAEAVRRWLAAQGSQAAAWAHRHRVSLVVVGGLLLVVAAAHGIGMDSNPAPIDDEGTYVAQARAVPVHHALSPYTYWYDHPPLGWIQIAAWTWLTHGFGLGHPAVAAGRQFMLICDLVSAALLYLVARRFGLRRGWAAVTVLLWGLSPLAISYQRLVYLDNVATPWLLAAVALALTPRRQLWAYASAGACLAVAVMSKETVLVYGPALIVLVWQSADRKTRAFCLTALGVTFGLVALAYPLYALLKGELVPGPGHVSLYDAVWFQLTGRQGSGGLLDSSSQAHTLVSGWLAVDPWVLGAGYVLLPVAICIRRLRPVAVALAVPLLVALRGGYLPEPYVIGLLPFAALVVAGGADAAWRRPRRPTAPGPRSWVGRARRLLVLGAAGAVLFSAEPAWASGIHQLTTTDTWGPLRQAETWIEGHVSDRDRLLVDNTMWVDLVEHGFDPRLGVVWFYKLGFANNLDPSVARRLPGGWRDFDYVVSTPSVRGALVQAPGQLPQVAAALSHSTTVAVFGTGNNRIEIRRIHSPRRSSAGTGQH
jgi:hypothetical protein